MDDRVKEMLSIATHREIPVMEVTRPELDRMAGFDGVQLGFYDYGPDLEQFVDAVLPLLEKRGLRP